MEKIIKIGVIGTGYLGRFHAHKYAALHAVHLVGVVDIDATQAKKVAHECNTHTFDTIQALLPLVDAVSIAVPTPLHYSVALICLQQGVDVLIEKPFTTTLAQADELIQTAKAHNCIIQVGHLERFNPAFLAMQSNVKSPLFIEAQRIAPFKKRGADVDVVLDLMIHDIDIILSLVQAPIVSMSSTGIPVITHTNDIANTRLHFANGCTANITVSRIAQETLRRMRFFQPGAYFSVDFGKKEYVTVAVDNKDQKDIKELNLTRYSVHEQDALELELADFVRHVRQRSQATVSGEDGRLALGLALQVIEQINVHQQEMKQRLYDQGQHDLLALLPFGDSASCA